MMMDEAHDRTFEFDRYINGQLMAEGVVITGQMSLLRAVREAARIASRGPNGEAAVLKLRLPLTQGGDDA
jgi:hypothetical protein